METILVTGATGYVGARLVNSLLAEGYKVRASGRSAGKLEGRKWAAHPNVELKPADLLDAAQARELARGCSAVYYLVHSMDSSGGSFEQRDRAAAENMTRAAEQEGLRRVIYLSGLGADSDRLSSHLRSRREVEEILRKGKVPVTVFRAAMILGAGSASFEILRYLVDRLPVMITPKWVLTRSQPIAIENVIGYLTGCLRCEKTAGEIYEIGGPDVLTYEELMRIYAEEAGLAPRRIFRVPVLTPRLSSYWIHFVTPVPAALARPLAEGLRNPVVCRDRRVLEVLRQDLWPVRRAVKHALESYQKEDIESWWTDAGALPPSYRLQEGDPGWAGGTLLKDCRTIEVNAPVQEVWPWIRRIGGRRGWYHADVLWRLRGLIDRLLGGVGTGRGRRDSEHLSDGDALDFWRVLKVREPSQLLLAAEMKLPGEATLEFLLEETSPGKTRITQTARFHPKGLLGIAYWHVLAPFHHYIFSGMLKEIAARIDNQSGRTVIQ